MNFTEKKGLDLLFFAHYVVNHIIKTKNFNKRYTT